MLIRTAQTSACKPAGARMLAVVVMAAMFAGCQSARVAGPLTANLAGNEPATQLEFWHTLATRPVTSNDEAFHGLLLYLDGQDPAGTYEQRVAALKARGLLPANFSEPADHAITRGTLAVAICRMTGIRGGLMMHLTGGAPRYAVRELQFVGLYPPSSPHQTFSGAEFVGIIGRVEDYQRQQLAGSPSPRSKKATSTRPAA